MSIYNSLFYLPSLARCIMDLSDVISLPDILIEQFEISYYIPSVTFGYLYIITNRYSFIYYSILLTSISTIAYFDINYYDRFDSMEARTDTPVLRYILYIISISFSIILYISFPLGIWFIFEQLSVTRATIRTTEVVSVTLLLINVSFISLHTLGIIFYKNFREELRS